MEQTIAVKITTDAAGANETVKGYKAQLKEATAELVNMSIKFGETSTEAANAAKKVAELKDSIGDAKALADTFNPDKKFVALGGALQGAVGGFSALQGAMGLFGSENKKVEEALLKVQSAMALQQGISGIAGAADSFKLLGAQGIKAFAGISKAIIATGIGALVVALGLIVAYWDDIIGAVNGVSASQVKLNESAQKNLDIQKKKQDSIGEQDNILKQQGKSERDILKIKIGQTNETIKAAEIQVQNQIVTNKAQTAAAQRNKDILQGLIRLVTAPLSILLKGIDLAGKALGQNFNLEQSFSGGLAKMIFDPEATAKKGEDTLVEQQKYLTKLKNDKAGMEISIKGIDDKATADKAKGSAKASLSEDKAAAKALKSAEDKAAKEKQIEDNRIAQQNATDDLITQTMLNRIKDDFTKKQNEIAVNNQKEIDKENELLNQKLISKETYDQRVKLINENTDIAQQALIDAKNLTAEEKEKKHQEELTKTAEEAAKAKIDIAEKENQHRQLMFDAIASGLNSVADIIGRDTAAGKALAVSASLINTYAAITGQLKAFAGVPIPGYAIAQAIATGVAGFGAVRNILKVNVPKGGGGGGANMSLPKLSASAPLQAQAATTTLDQQSINSIGQASSRAFVLETDVTNNQERIARLNRAARIN